ncbi:UNVERIFIED_CONTAM: hypothetical protein FKN15_012696 [Acipenser sinensis]
MLGKLHSDQDKGDGTLKYVLSGDGAGSLFLIDENSGDIHATKRLDREEKAYYTLRAQAVNKRTGRPLEPESEFVIKIHDINDNEPKFTKDTYIASVPEMSDVGTPVVQVTATDDDDATYGNSARVVYSILQGQPYFSVEPDTGTPVVQVTATDDDDATYGNSARVVYSILQGQPYFSVEPDTDNPKQVGRVPVYIRILDINDNAPEFATFYETFVCENAKAGQRIQTVSAVDNDDPIGGHKFFFSLPAEESVNANFTVRDNKDNTAGILTRRSGFSRLERSTYLVPVVISDGGYPMQSSTNTLTIRVCTCDREGNMQSCNAEPLILPAGLSTGALIAILLCIIILLIIVMLFAALRRQKKKEPLIISKEDVRDNIVSYNDEGGGEEDTQAFDIGTLRNPEAIDDNKLRRDIIPETLFPSRRTAPTRDKADVRDFINQRLQENDTDPTAPPYDSLATYAYEGNGSIAESLSSLESATTEGDQDYNYLSEWGPRFKKLADMYGGEDSDKDS